MALSTTECPSCLLRLHPWKPNPSLKVPGSCFTMASPAATLPEESALNVSTENGNTTASENAASSADENVPVDTSKRAAVALRALESDESAPNTSEANALDSQLPIDHNSHHTDNTNQQRQSSLHSNENMDKANSNATYAGYSHQAQSSSKEHDDMDSAALLESLASYDPSQGHNLNSAYSEPDSNCLQNGHHHQQTNQFENHHFASLLQAAATAGQSQENDRRSHYETHSRDSRSLQEWNTHSLNGQQQPRNQPQRRKHSEISHDASSAPNTEPSSLWNRSTRRKLTDADNAALARERAIWGPESDHSENEESSQSYTPLSPSSARTAGVHSAAALFRKPTPASKKYTRPPMSKLFTSLELTPEQFLHLQAAAKSYMLDPAHPDRYNCVGSKAKVDTDMVKLKLFNCVEVFLEEKGWGDRCWGENSERDPSKTWRLRWPESRNKIITSVTPLLRRMVTNERQRRYAVETRSKDKGGKRVTAASMDQHNAQPPPQEENQLPPEIDPKLGDYHYSLPVSTTHATPLETPSRRDDSPDISQPMTSFRVVLLNPHDANGVIHTNDVSSTPNNSQQQVHQYIQSWFADPSVIKQFKRTLVIERMRAHLPDGFNDVSSVEEWDNAVETVQQTTWMNRELKIVVNLGIIEEAAENENTHEARTEQQVSVQGESS